MVCCAVLHFHPPTQLHIAVWPPPTYAACPRSTLPQAAQEWQERVPSLGSSEATAMVHVISVQPPGLASWPPSSTNGSNIGSAAGSSTGGGSGMPAGGAGAGTAAVFSAQQLVQGLRWLAARAPPQPVLEVRTRLGCIRALPFCVLVLQLLPSES